MFISQKLRIGFIHIPKCGGTTIKQQLSPLADTETSSWAKQTARRLLTRGGNRYDGFSRHEPEIQAFVRSYYERDFDLVDRVHAAFKGKPEVAG